MMKSILKCAVVGGVIAFVWYMFSWMILPWHAMVMHRFTDEKAVASAMMQYAPESGVYILPSMPAAADQEGAEQDTMEKAPARHGPFAYANVVREGMREPGMLPTMLTGLITQIIGAGLVTWLLMQTKITKYWNRVQFVTLVGFIVGFLAFVPLWNWWGFTAGYAVVGILEMTIAWFFAGLALAKMAK